MVSISSGVNWISCRGTGSSQQRINYKLQMQGIKMKEPHLDIGLQPLGVRALSRNRDASLNRPAQRDLTHIRLVRLRYPNEVWVLEEQRIALSCITLRVRIESNQLTRTDA